MNFKVKCTQWTFQAWQGTNRNDNFKVKMHPTKVLGKKCHRWKVQGKNTKDGVKKVADQNLR